MMKKISFLSYAVACVAAPAAAADNKVSITQIGQGNYVAVQQRAATTEEKKILEQSVQDENGNQIIVLQQGSTNISDFTQQGRLNNVLSTGSVAPGAAAQPSGENQ